MLTRIRNAINVRKSEVSLPHSKAKEAVARLLADTNFVNSVEVTGEGINKTLTVLINDASENARITEIARLSKPGSRHYVRASGIPVVKRGRGLVVVSTSHGMMTGDEAKKQGIGGELICEVY
jgi:small subunit ribosomal protein S8